LEALKLIRALEALSPVSSLITSQRAVTHMALLYRPFAFYRKNAIFHLSAWKNRHVVIFIVILAISIRTDISGIDPASFSSHPHFAIIHTFPVV